MFDDSNLWSLKDDNSGLEYKTASELKERYESLFSELFPNLNTDASTPQGQMITSLIEQDMATISGIQDLVNILFLGGSGKILDMWAYNMFRVVRKEAIKGSVAIDIVGNPNTLIPAGFTISDGTLTYETQADEYVGTDGKATITFYQTEASTDISVADTITQIKTPVVGIDSVNNPASSLAGTLIETDSELKARCLRYGSTFKNSSFASIMSSVANVSGVEKIGGYENYTNLTVTYKGIEIEAHSFAIVVSGGEDKDIAEALRDSKAPGAGMVGDTEYTLDVNNYEVTYKWYRPISKALKIEVGVKVTDYTPQNYEEVVQEALNQYIATIEIGDTITQPEVANAIAGYTDEFILTFVKIGIKGEQATGYDSIELNLNEMATLSADDVNVEAN